MGKLRRGHDQLEAPHSLSAAEQPCPLARPASSWSPGPSVPRRPAGPRPPTVRSGSPSWVGDSWPLVSGAPLAPGASEAHRVQTETVCGFWNASLCGQVPAPRRPTHGEEGGGASGAPRQLKVTRGLLLLPLKRRRNRQKTSQPGAWPGVRAPQMRPVLVNKGSGTSPASASAEPDRSGHFWTRVPGQARTRLTSVYLGADSQRGSCQMHSLFSAH